jgi:hypothetical protein
MYSKLRLALDVFDTRARKNPVLVFLTTFAVMVTVCIVFSALAPLLPNFVRDLIFFLLVGPIFFGAFFLFSRVLRFFEGRW